MLSYRFTLGRQMRQASTADGSRTMKHQDDSPPKWVAAKNVVLYNAGENRVEHEDGTRRRSTR